MPTRSPKPDDLPSADEERRLRAAGYAVVAGVDEAGRGPLAGPVVAAAAVLPEGFENRWGVRDSKLMGEREREEVFERLQAEGVLFGVALVNHRTIDRINILQATRLAMRKAVERLSVRPDFVLVDGMDLPAWAIPHRKVVKGDRLVLSIAAASVAAKVVRDRIMRRIEEVCPGWGFARHKGYPVPEHLEALRRLGVSAFHRTSFAPVAAVMGRTA